MRVDLYAEKHLSGIERVTGYSYDVNMPKIDIRSGDIHITAEGHKAQATDFGIFHNEIEQVTGYSYDVNMPKMDIRSDNIHMTVEGHKAQVTDFGIFHNERGCFVHSMLLNRQFKIDKLIDILVGVKKHGGDPQEYLTYALKHVGLDENEELSDYEVEQITSAVDRAGRW